VETVQFYRFHTEDYSLDNTNVADGLGDATFVCLAASFSNDSLVSLYSVSVNTTWGQYALCNFNVCVAEQHHLVGQEAPSGFTHDGGQCNLTTGLGNWYSLDDGGKCSPDSPVGTDGCTWQELALNKTITASCLTQIGFFNACIADGGPPFLKAASVFEGAFLSDDPSKGGCPAVNASFIAQHQQQRSPPPSSSKRPSKDENQVVVDGKVVADWSDRAALLRVLLARP